MTTRRNLLIIAGGATLLGGCRDESRAGGPGRAEAVPDVVLAETRQGLVVLGGPRPRLLGPTAVTTVARAEASGKTNDPAYVRLTEAYYARHLCRLNPMPTFLAKAGAAIGQNPVYIHLNGPSEFQFTGALASLDLAPQLRRLHMPTLVTCGEYDEAPPFVGARITRIVTGSMLHSFSGLSHMSHIEDPARVVGATRAFLQKVA